MDNQENFIPKKRISNNFTKTISKSNNNLYDENDHSDLKNEEDLNYLNDKVEEQNKELIEKLNKINALNEQNKNKDIFIQTLKKTIENLQEKLASTEKVKQHINNQNKQILETETESNIIKAEYM